MSSVRGISRFQSIGVTKDWRLGLDLNFTDALLEVFPINRRHQGLATGPVWAQIADLPTEESFQLIGVTKDWRLALL